jgi:eukaryotic-like serine/threonine-protein kinase
MDASVTEAQDWDRVGEGTLIAGKYRIEKLIARGGMGVLYRAWQPLIARNVAIKIVRPELMTRSDAPARFLREARVLAQLRTDHVCKVLDAGALDDGLPYMVLEYLDGDDLRNVLNAKGRFAVPRAVDLILQVAEALAEAHALGIVHRDVKPENLFLLNDVSGAERIKLLDFGICQTESNAARLRTPQQADDYGLGSPHYMAPEQISAPHAFDPRIDIWSLAVVLYELISGDPPFDGDDVTAICAQVLGREPASLREVCTDLPQGLEHVVARCLSKSPDGRYADVAELALALAPYGSAAAGESSARVGRTLHLPHAVPQPPVAPAESVQYGPALEVASAPPALPSNVVPISRTRRKRKAVGKRVSAVLVAGAVLGTVAGTQVVDQPMARELVNRTLEGAPPIVRATITAVGVGVDAAIDTAIRRYSSPPAEQHNGGDSRSDAKKELGVVGALEHAHSSVR